MFDHNSYLGEYKIYSYSLVCKVANVTDGAKKFHPGVVWTILNV